jgi:hypothetical protein
MLQSPPHKNLIPEIKGLLWFRKGEGHWARRLPHSKCGDREIFLVSILISSYLSRSHADHALARVFLNQSDFGQDHPLYLLLPKQRSSVVVPLLISIGRRHTVWIFEGCSHWGLIKSFIFPHTGYPKLLIISTVALGQQDYECNFIFDDSFIPLY